MNWENKRFIKINDDLIRSENLSSEDKFIFAVMKSNNPLGISTISIVSLLKQMGMSHSDSRNKSGIKASLSKLEEYEYIEVFEDQAEMIKTEVSKMKPSRFYFVKSTDTSKGEGYFTMFDIEVIKRFMSIKKREKFGLFSVYASIVAPIFESESSSKVSFLSQERIQFETGLSDKTVSKYIYILKEDLRIIDFSKYRFTMKKQPKGKVQSKTHNFYWRAEDAGIAVQIGIADIMEKMGYNSRNYHIQEIDRNNNPVEVK